MSLGSTEHNSKTFNSLYFNSIASFLFIVEGHRAFIENRYGIIWSLIPNNSVYLFYDSTCCKRQAERFSIQI